MKFIEIWRNKGFVIFINCKDIRDVKVNGNDFTFSLFSEQTVYVKAWPGAVEQFSNFLSNEDTQKVFKFSHEGKEGKNE